MCHRYINFNDYQYYQIINFYKLFLKCHRSSLNYNLKNKLFNKFYQNNIFFIQTEMACKLVMNKNIELPKDFDIMMCLSGLES